VYSLMPVGYFVDQLSKSDPKKRINLNRYTSQQI